MLFDGAYGRGYLYTALQAGPELMARAIRGMTAEAADLRPDPDRFTIREVIAHMADWDPIFLYRMKRMRGKDNPTLQGYEPDDLARDNNYAQSDPFERLEAWRKARDEIVEFAKSLSTDEFKRTADRPEIGQISIFEQSVLIPLHDIYHLKQVQEILGTFIAHSG